MPVTRVEAMVLAGPASDLQGRACAGDLSPGEIQALWTHDAAREGALTTGAVDLTPYAGAALSLRVEDAAGVTAWFLDIQNGGAAVLTLE